MAAPSILSNGIGGATGDALVTLYPLYHTGDVWYVSSSAGSDAASPRGKDRARPLATLSQAYTNAAAGDTIVFLSGHSESISSSQSIAKQRLRLIGEGTGSNRPKFTCGGTVDMISITQEGCQLRNLYFPASTAVPTSRVNIGAAGTIIENCYFESGANDTAAAVKIGAAGGNHSRINDTTFISTASLVTAQPNTGLSITGVILSLIMDSVIFDGGTTGWSTYAMDAGSVISGLYATNISLLHDSDVNLVGSTGVLHVSSASSSARVVWTS